MFDGWVTFRTPSPDYYAACVLRKQLTHAELATSIADFAATKPAWHSASMAVIMVGYQIEACGRVLKQIGLGGRSAGRMQRALGHFAKNGRKAWLILMLFVTVRRL